MCCYTADISVYYNLALLTLLRRQTCCLLKSTIASPVSRHWSRQKVRSVGTNMLMDVGCIVRMYSLPKLTMHMLISLSL